MDYGWRQYDPAIARWMTIDPWATKYKSWSPYNYGFDNPVRYADFMGLGPEDKKDPNGMSETQVYSRDGVNKDGSTVTTVTQETRTKTTTENDDGTTTTNVSRSVTTNTITKNNETGETSTQYGKTSTTSYSETSNSEGKIVSKSDPTTQVSKGTSKDNPVMKNLNAWTNKISSFNSSHDKTFNQTIASQGRMAMTAAALAPTILIGGTGTQLFMSGGGGSGLIIRLADPIASSVGAALAQAPGAVVGAMADVTHSGGAYVHSVSQTKIKEGAQVSLMQHNILDR